MGIKQPASRHWSIRSEELESKYLENRLCLHQPLPQIAGSGFTDIYQLDQGLSYIETSYKPARNLAVLSRTNYQDSRMVVTVTLKGCSSFKSQNGDEVLFSEGHTTITSFNSSIGERLYQAGQETTQLRFSISKQWSELYLDEKLSMQLFNKGDIQQLSFRPISLQGISAAQQILACNIDGNLKRLFLQGQAMTLLASELAHLLNGCHPDPEKFNLRDKGIAQAAKDVLVREFRSPPSVNELAKRVGTNQFKLKQLFRHYFDNTPYGVLLEIRMKQAYQLLESTRCQVSHAADFVGYGHASNFSSAFISYFGFPPKHIAKNKNQQ